MSKASKIITAELEEKARQHLEAMGKNGRTSIKLMAIIAARTHGVTNVAKIFGTSKVSLIAWAKQLKEDGAERLEIQAGRGRKSPFTKEQEEVIHGWMLADTQLTIDQVRTKIEEDLGILTSRSSTHRLMKKLGFSYITPRPVDVKQDTASLEEAKKKSAPST